MCIITGVKHLEEPEEPARHNVVGDSKRDGAKAEKSKEDVFISGRMVISCNTSKYKYLC